MENKFSLSSFPLLDVKLFKAFLEPQISTIKRYAIDNIYKSTWHGYVLLTHPNQSCYYSVGFIALEDQVFMPQNLLKIQVVLKNELWSGRVDTVWLWEDEFEKIEAQCDFVCEYFLENGVRKLQSKWNKMPLFGKRQDIIFPIDKQAALQLSGEEDERTSCIKIKLAKNMSNCEDHWNFEISAMKAGFGGTGGSRVWDASLFLAQWIIFNNHLFNNCTVLELGAGLGLPGFVSGMFASKVFLTDMISEVLELLERNKSSIEKIIRQARFHYLESCSLEEMTMESLYVVKRLDWFDTLAEGAQAQAMAGPVPVCDVVVLADVIYSDYVVEALIQAILSSGCHTLVACLPAARVGITAFLANVRLHFSVTRLALPPSCLCERPACEVLETFIYVCTRS